MRLSLNLATRTFLDRRKVYATYGLLLALAGLFFIFNLAAVVRTQLQIRTVRAHLSEIGIESVDEPTVDPAEVDNLQKHIDFANDILAKESFRWTELLNHLEDVVRRGITIQSLRPNYRDGSLQVVGLARGLGDFKSFISRIQSSEHFDTVYLFDQSRVEVEESAGRKKTAISFSIQLKGAF